MDFLIVLIVLGCRLIVFIFKEFLYYFKLQLNGYNTLINTSNSQLYRDILHK